MMNHDTFEPCAVLNIERLVDSKFLTKLLFLFLGKFCILGGLVFVSFARRHFSHDLLAHHLVDDVSRRKLHEAKKCKTKKIKKHEHGGKAPKDKGSKGHLFTEHSPWIDNCRFDLIENFHFIPVD